MGCQVVAESWMSLFLLNKVVDVFIEVFGDHLGVWEFWLRLGGLGDNDGFVAV